VWKRAFQGVKAGLTLNWYVLSRKAKPRPGPPTVVGPGLP